MTRSSNPSQDKRSLDEVKEQGSDSCVRMMPHHRDSVERVSVNQLTETTLHGKLTTSHKQGTWLSPWRAGRGRRCSRPPVEDRRATVPAIQDMVGVSGHLTARNPRHGVHRVGEIGGSDNRKVACPLFLSVKLIHFAMGLTALVLLIRRIDGDCL
jgi:hypothetical protein